VPKLLKPRVRQHTAHSGCGCDWMTYVRRIADQGTPERLSAIVPQVVSPETTECVASAKSISPCRRHIYHTLMQGGAQSSERDLAKKTSWLDLTRKTHREPVFCLTAGYPAAGWAGARQPISWQQGAALTDCLRQKLQARCWSPGLSYFRIRQFKHRGLSPAPRAPTRKL
jgi:hypothetical protein